MPRSDEEVRLGALQREDEAEARAAHEEMLGEGFSFLLDWDPELPWSRYLERLERQRRGEAAPSGRVPATFLAAHAGSALVGRVSIRHALNPYLAEVGGHIGYGVRMAHRGRGHATEILRQALVIARDEGVERALVTCDLGNAASAAVITKLGGRLEDVRTHPNGTRVRRYWIET